MLIEYLGLIVLLGIVGGIAYALLEAMKDDE